MPNQDGLEVIVHIRQKELGVPVIAISAPDNQLYLENARGLGAVHVFAKPFKLADIAGAVDDLLST